MKAVYDNDRYDEVNKLEQVLIREMKAADYSAVINFWRETPGLALSDADTEENIGVFLARNPGLSFVAELADRLLGTILCGHDGRRGFIYHLAVHHDYRRKGIGRLLADCCLNKLKEAGISKCHLFVLADNDQGMAFWDKIGFQRREDILIYSHNRSSK